MALSESDALRRCPLCGKDHFTLWRFGLLRCESCRLVLSPAIWQTEVNERMEDEWFGEGYEQRKSSIWVEWFEARNNRRTLSRLATLALPVTRLLEIGVGSGSFLHAARDAGFDVMGCDLSALICRQAEQTHGVAMHCGSLDSLPGQARFDVVVMNHVLEHVQNPVMFLQGVRRLLAPQGIVHVAVPNVACWEAKLSGWTSYEPYHLTYFDRATLQRAIDAAELQTILVATHESFSGWFLALLRTAIGANRVESAVVRQRTPVCGSDKRRCRSATVEHVYRAAMTMWGLGLWPLRRLQGYWGRGDELVCIAKISGGVNR